MLNPTTPMHPRSLTILALILAFLGACSENAPDRTSQLADGGGRDLHFVSFYKLLARPEDYDGKVIVVEGALSASAQWEIGVLYPNIDALHHRARLDSLVIKLAQDQRQRLVPLNEEFVQITGTFRRSRQPDGYTGVGSIEGISGLVELPVLDATEGL